jgi:hypothetical protein
MDGPNGEYYNWDGTTGNYESTLSLDSSECWGRSTGPGDTADWQPAAYQDSSTGQTIVPVTGWGDVDHASEQTVGRGDWWLAYKASEIPGDFGVTDATICFRYYKQVSSDYAITSDTCGGGADHSNRNKFAELNAGNNPYQLEEDPTPGGGCHTVSESSLTRGIMACWDSGPASEGCLWLTPTVKLSQAISHPIRIENCYETTDLATGANGVVTSYVTPYPYTTTSTYTAPTATVGAPTKDYTWSANIDHTGGGTSWNGYFMFSVWDDVNSHTIGAACEIEGGC